MSAPDFLVAVYAAVEAVREGGVDLDVTHTTETEGRVETLRVVINRTADVVAEP